MGTVTKVRVKQSSRCRLSPTGVHYWVLDEADFGVCRYCSETRQFPKLEWLRDWVGEVVWEEQSYMPGSGKQSGKRTEE